MNPNTPGPDSVVPDSIKKLGLSGRVDMDALDAKMHKRLAGSTSWEGFFKEFAMKMAFFLVLLVVVWIVSATR